MLLGAAIDGFSISPGDGCSMKSLFVKINADLLFALSNVHVSLGSARKEEY